MSVAASKTDSDIAASVSEEPKLGEIEDSSDDDESSLPKELKPNKHKVNEAFNTIKAYLQCDSTDTSEQIHKLLTLENEVNSLKQTKQSKISDFF